MGQTLLRSGVGLWPAATGSEASQPDGAFGRALERLRQQGLAWMRQDLIANGDLIGAEAVCRFLGGMSRDDLEARVERRELLALPPVELESLGQVEGFPRIQFTDTGVLPGLARVLAALPDEDPWVQFHYLVNSDRHLAGRRPIDLLAEGKVDTVVAAARLVHDFEQD